MQRKLVLAFVLVIVTWLPMSTASTLGASNTGGPGQRLDYPILRELPDDPYLSGPGEPPSTFAPRSGPIVRDYFVSVQVNVDELGQNIPGDAANEPSIAIDPTDPNKIVIGWRQFDNVASNFRQAGYAYSHDAGETWTFPGVLDPGQFRSDPVLDADAEGDFYYYSLSSITSAEMFKSVDGGITWAGPIPGRGGDKAWMTVDRTGGMGDGNIYASWNIYYSCCPGHFTRSTDGGQTFLEPIIVPDTPYWGTLAVGPDGELYQSGAGIVLAKSTNAQDPNVTPEFDFSHTVQLGGYLDYGTGPNPDGLLGQVWVATDHSDGPSRGNVYLFASVNPPGTEPLDVMFARSVDGGLTFSEPVRVNNDPPGNFAFQWFGTMSVAPNGRIDVIWNDTRNSGETRISELFYAYSWDEGVTWWGNLPVSPPFDSWVGWPNQNKLGDYYDMVSDDPGVNIAYAATFNGEQDVYFLRLAPDCDADGVSDAEELAAGTSTDCNSNKIPDPCEIAAGLFTDCNGNDVPDECDVVFYVSSSSPQLSPIGHDSPQSHTFSSPQEAATDVVLTFTASADINGQLAESVDIFLNGEPVGNVFSEAIYDCSVPPEVDELVIEADTFNAAVAGADAVVDMVARLYVNAAACDSQSFINVTLAYGVAGTSLDCNDTGLPDECEAGDFDGDGMIQLSDAGPAAACVTGPCGAPPCDPPLYGDPCCILADLNHDGATDLSDYAALQNQLSIP